MKVKIFSNTDPDQLEKEINHWLETNPQTICDKLQSGSTDNAGNAYIDISIWYEHIKIEQDITKGDEREKALVSYTKL